MAIIKKLKTFFSLNQNKRRLILEAFLYLGWARFLKSKPFYEISPQLGIHMEETVIGYSEDDHQIIRDISEAINIMSHYTFWESLCLVRAIAALKMLEKRRIESTLYLGMARNESGKMIAHAWLRSGPIYVTGFEGMKRFTVVGKFAKKISIKG
ncbi:lasso peptide biosynthesis B2 protein [Bacillaceae bacterium IKA-2]|nr:lasso peptide biosynthesis B2 protein [Bacillaceae bacterium IKA-2]